jgi:hypothetical protein
MPFPCHAVPLRVWIYTVRPCLTHTSHAAPVPYHDHAVLKATSQGHGTAQHGHGICELTSAVQRRYLGDLPAFGFFRLPRGVPQKLLPEAYHSHMLFGYFRLTRGLSRRTRHCRRMARGRHGICELTRQGNGTVV